MKILYHYRTLADGAEGIHIREMIDAFRMAGHEVVVEAFVQPQDRGAGHQGALKRVKAALPEAVFELAAVASSILDYFSVGRAIRRHRPDLLYKRHALNDCGAVLAARRHGVPVVLEVNRLYTSRQHMRFERRRLTWLCRWCERFTVNRASVVAAVSTPLADAARMMARDPARVMVLPNGANPDRFRPQPELRAQVRRELGWGDAVVVGWAGILREWHGVELLVRAVSRVQDLQLLIIGDGPDRARLESVIAGLGATDRVTFTGRVSHDEVVRYIGAVDIAVSAADRTGHASPMKLLEYMAMERATVAPKLPNIEDLIEDEVDGLLFEADNEDALAATLRRLKDDEALRRRLGHQGRQTVLRTRNWRRNADIVVRRITGAPGPARVGSAARLPIA